MKISELKDTALNGLNILKSRWNKPKDGYEVSYKEVTAASLAAMGNASIIKLCKYVEVSATAAVVSMVFGISFTYIYVITTLTYIATYCLIGITGQVMDNMGRIPKQTFWSFTAISVTILTISGALGAIDYFTPLSFLLWFNALIPNFMLHIFIIALFKILPVYLNILIFRTFGKKWGVFKPWLVLMGIPVVISIQFMVYLPYSDMTTANLLIAVNFLSSLTLCLSTSYRTDYMDKFQIRITRNSQERVALSSIFPIVGGLLTSILGLFLSPIATLLGCEVNSIEIYRVVMPVFGIVSVLPTALLLLCHERVSVAVNHEAKISFKEGLKSAIKNKYLWIVNLSTAFGVISTFSLMVVEWMLLYGTKMQWLSSVLITITSLPATPANLMTPFLTKRMSRRSIFVTFKVIQVIAIMSTLLIIKIPNDAIMLTLLVFVCCICTVCNKPASVVSRSCLGEAWDYHQWKFGERMEGASTYFNFITIPITIGLGYMTPWAYELVGFIGDYDIMYDSVMREKIFAMHAGLYAFEIFMCMVPFIFYDLSNDMLKRIQKELAERAKLEEEGTLDPPPEPFGEVTATAT